MKNLALFICLGWVMLACSTFQDGEEPFAIDNYHEQIERFSVSRKDYRGFYNTYQFDATLLNSQIRQQQVNLMAQTKSWPASKVEEENKKLREELSLETEVFLSFFTPNKKDNKFIGKTAVWQVILEVDGQKYEGTVSKNIMPMPDLLLLYPYFNRWSIPYTVKFKVPVTTIEKSPTKLIITGSLGLSENVFPALAPLAIPPSAQMDK